MAENTGSNGGEAKKKAAPRMSIEELNRRKAAKVAAGDTNAKGGRPKVRLTRAEQEQIQRQGLKLLYSDSYEVFRRLISTYLETGEGAQDAMKAAMRVVDQVEGKAAQTVKQETTVTAIEYRSAAWRPLPDVEAERARRVLEGPLALPPGEDEADEDVIDGDG